MTSRFPEYQGFSTLDRKIVLLRLFVRLSCVSLVLPHPWILKRTGEFWWKAILLKYQTKRGGGVLVESYVKILPIILEVWTLDSMSPYKQT